MKSKTKQSCFRCWFGGVECQRGTLPGICIPCGGSGSRHGAQPYVNFFNNGLIHFLSCITQTLCIALGSDDSYYNIIEIQNTGPTGLIDPYVFEIHGIYDAPNANLGYSLEQKVWESFMSNISARNTTTDLVTKAIKVRCFLALLLATNVTERLKVFRDGAYTYESIPSSDLSLHLTNIILFRLNSLISDVMAAVLLKGHSDGEDYQLDVTAATAVLYTGLMDTCDGIKKGILKPLCGGSELGDLLFQQIQSTAGQIEQHLDCKLNWSAHLKGPLEDLRSISMITKMDLTLERRLYDPILTPSGSSASALFDNENTPASLTDQQSFTDTGVEALSPVTPDGVSSIKPMSFHVPEASVFIPTFGTSGPMSSQFSKLHGFTPWDHGHEQNYDTWRQS